MNLASKRIIKGLLKKYELKPFKGWGQNFLIDKLVLRKIIESADLKPNDIVLEIGPGIGTLTLKLAKKAGKVIAIEKDKRMVEILREVLEGWEVKNVEIVEGNILKTNIQNLISNTKYKVVANLPYYITAPVLRKFLEVENPPKEMIFVVQKEVAQRICAKPPDMNLLAVSVQFYAKAEILFYVSKSSFYPKPKVDSAIIKVIPQPMPMFSPIVENVSKERFKGLFFEIVKTGFSQPRKQIVNNLSKMLKLNKGEVKEWLLKNGIEPSQRAETLTIEDWIKLTKSLKKIFYEN